MQKSRLAAFLLCAFAGGLGAHRFYTGHMIPGVLQVLTCGGLGFWVLFDLIRIGKGIFADSHGRTLNDPPEWTPTLLFCLFLPITPGFHRLYTGRPGTFLLFAFTFGGFGIWWLYDLIMILTERFTTSDGNLITKRGIARPTGIKSAKRRGPKKAEEAGEEEPELGSLENQIEVCKEYIKLWRGFFRFISESPVGKTIRPEDEKAFSQLVYRITYDHFKFVKLMGEDFSGGKKIINIMDQCVSLSGLQEIADATFGALQVSWHQCFLEMHKTLGRLVDRLPPEEPIEGQEAAPKSPDGGRGPASPTPPARAAQGGGA